MEGIVFRDISWHWQPAPLQSFAPIHAEAGDFPERRACPHGA